MPAGWWNRLTAGFPSADLQVFAADKGVSRTISFYCLSILNAASVFGRVLPNFLADSFGPMNLMVSCVHVAPPNMIRLMYNIPIFYS